MNKLFFPLLFVIALSAGAQDSLITNKVDSVSSKILEDLSIQTKS